MDRKSNWELTLCVLQARALILFDHRKQSIAHHNGPLLISDLNQFSLYSHTNSGNEIRHTMVGTHELHNYPFSTGHSLTDINELSENHKKTNWIEKKNEQAFCHLVNTNSMDWEFYIKST